MFLGGVCAGCKTHSLPSGEKRVKGIETSVVFSIFVPYHSKNLPSNAPSLFMENICLTGYIGAQKSTFSKVPVHTSTGVFPLAMQAFLVL
jgi:hypothetical protein